MNIIFSLHIRPLQAALLWVALLATPAFSAQTFWVTASGNDTNSGSALQPFRQIRKALNVVSAGDEILVSDGSYLGFTIDSLAGTSNAPVTIRATGTNAIVLPTTDRSDNRDTIYILDSTYVILDGFRSFNANRAALRIQDGHHVTIRNCVFGNNATWGILTGQSPDLVIENNECYGSVTQHGIYIANSADRPVVRGNRCYNNYGSGIQLNADVNTPPGDGIITGALIENNLIYNNGIGGGGGLNLDGVQDSIVRNNLLFTNHASGIIFFQIDGAEGPRGNQILHNTIDQAPDGRWALGMKQTTGTNYVRNNILLTRNATRGGLEFSDSTDAANTDTDYNLLNYVTTNEGNSRLTLAQWQALGADLHSRTGAVATVFVNANLGNYLLRTNSPALNAALSLPAATRDFDGLSRPFGAASDLGCYEQTPLSLRWDGAVNGNWHLRIEGGAGTLNEINASTDLNGWSTILSTIRSNRPVELMVTNAAVQQFYRADSTP